MKKYILLSILLTSFSINFGHSVDVKTDPNCIINGIKKEFSEKDMKDINNRIKNSKDKQFFPAEYQDRLNKIVMRCFQK